MEIQYLIAYVCYDSPRVAQRGDSLNDAELAKEMYDQFYGAEGGDPEKTVTFLEQFLHGIYKFKGLFTDSEDPDELGQIILTMPQKLHRYYGVRIFVGTGSITKEIVSQTNFTNTTRILGVSLLTKAKAVVKTCKKMMAIVTASGSPYRDGTFPSGTNWDDYIKWCLEEMQKECDREADAKKIRSPTADGIATTATTAATTTTDGATAAAGAGAAAANDVAGVGAKDANPYFKCGSGFLAWALYGHIPLHDSPGMASLLFSEVKTPTSYGRGTSTRSAMRKAAMAASMPPVDNRHGKKRAEMEVPVQPDNEAADDLSLYLRQTLEQFETKDLEKEEKEHHGMCVRLVRDKLVARRGKREMILQQLNLISKYKKKTDHTMYDKMQENEAEIEKLELELVTLQEEECVRRRSYLDKKRCMLATRSSTSVPTSVEATPMIEKGDSFESTSGLESSSSGGNDDGGNVGMDDNTATATSMPYKNSTICMECNTIPTDHICSKCKRIRVCSVCCDTNRDLQNNPWCKACFENETPASQEIIRNGEYNYK